MAYSGRPGAQQGGPGWWSPPTHAESAVKEENKQRQVSSSASPSPSPSRYMARVDGVRICDRVGGVKCSAGVVIWTLPLYTTALAGTLWHSLQCATAAAR
ncbi:hypothetical protein DPSP01_008971 [Paraphaeosphaeria sporulosa]